MTDEMVDGQMSDEPAFAALMERHRRELHVHDLLLDEVAPSARATLREQLPERPSERPAQDLSEDERRLLDGFIATHESGDAVAAAALMREDIRVTMPPHPFLYEGRDAIARLEHPWHDRSAPGSTGYG